MRSGVFTTAAVDNVDHNHSATTSKDHFHGTGISLTQHPSDEFAGTDRGVVLLDQSSSARSISPLPSDYTNVLPAAVTTKTFSAPPATFPVKPTDMRNFTDGKEIELAWLNEAMASISQEELEKGN